MATSDTSRNKDTVISASIDQILENLPIGSTRKAISNHLRGINFRQTGNPVPMAKDNYGFTFFTRPQLNLTTMNVSNYRGLYSLLTSKANSYQRYTRMMLDPRLGYKGEVTCPFVDNLNVFIPMLTNSIMSVSGWPDINVPTHNYEAGMYGQEHGFVDGATNNYESFDLDVTFKNMKGNPILYFFYIWIKYESLVYEGILNPYTDMISEDEIDYNTRIYRLVLDQTKRYVTFAGATGASFPMSVPMGNLLDYNKETPYNTRNSDVSIRFRNYGFTAFDDILKLEFNEAVSIFNPNMRKLLAYDLNSTGPTVSREDPTETFKSPGGYVKIPYALAATVDAGFASGNFFSINHKAYPYINMATSELEWWIDESNFKSNLSNVDSLVET